MMSVASSDAFGGSKFAAFGVKNTPLVADFIISCCMSFRRKIFIYVTKEKAETKTEKGNSKCSFYFAHMEQLQ